MTVRRLVCLAVVLALAGCSSERPQAARSAPASTTATPPAASRAASPSPSRTPPPSASPTPACPWKPGGPKRPEVLGQYGGQIPLDSRCLHDGLAGGGDLYRAPQESGDPIVGRYTDGEVAGVSCAVRTGGPVIDTALSQSNAWVRVATSLLGLSSHAFVPHAAIGYADLGALQECAENTYR